VSSVNFWRDGWTTSPSTFPLSMYRGQLAKFRVPAFCCALQSKVAARVPLPEAGGEVDRPQA